MKKYRIVNARNQPVDLYGVYGITVISPYGQVLIDENMISNQQIRTLEERGVIVVKEFEEMTEAHDAGSLKKKTTRLRVSSRKNASV